MISRDPSRAPVAESEEAKPTSLAEQMAEGPAVAAVWAAKLDVGPERAEALCQVAVAWAGRNPAAALAWAAGLPDGEERQAAITNVLSTWADRDPAAALSHASFYDLGAAASSIKGNLIGQWAGVDFEGAMAYVGGEPAGEAKEEQLARLAIAGAAHDPAEAAEFVLEAMTPSPLQAETALAVLHHWVEDDPAGAAAWVDSFPEGELRTRAKSEVFGTVAAMASSR